MIEGNGSSGMSLKKMDLPNQRMTSVGYSKLIAATKATLGATGISLTSLTAPPEMLATGFVQPSPTQLQNAQLLFYKNNITVKSSIKGILDPYLSYVIASSTQINFVDFTAEDGEIFTIIVDYIATSGLKVVDADRIAVTGTLAISAVDFNVGTPFKTGMNSSSQIGSVIVYKDTTLQLRNTGNSSVVLDGNYYEVDAGGGLGTIVRFNTPDVSNTHKISVLSTDILSERPDGSMMAVIEAIQGKLNNMATYVADAIGQTAAAVLGAAPSNVDLKAFGDRVVTLEQNRARIDLSNTWTAYQALLGKSDGVTIPSSYVGEKLTGTFLTPTWVSTTPNNIASLVLPAGVWMVYGKAQVGVAGTLQTLFTASVSSTSLTHNAKTQATDNTSGITSDRNITTGMLHINTTGTTVYLVGTVGFTGTAPVSATGSNDLFAIRIA